jgi:hypothetical protein
MVHSPFPTNPAKQISLFTFFLQPCGRKKEPGKRFGPGGNENETSNQTKRGEVNKRRTENPCGQSHQEQ